MNSSGMGSRRRARLQPGLLAVAVEGDEVHAGLMVRTQHEAGGGQGACGVTAT